MKILNKGSRVMKKIVKNDIKEVKQRYFDQIFTAYKSDIKKTWKTVNESLNRSKLGSNE